MKWLLILHMIFSFVSFGFAIISATLTGIALSSWSYSCFLTLREWQIIIYMLFLVFGTIYGILNVFSQPTETLFFYIVNLVFYGFALYFCWLAYKQFRTSGGIYGGKSRAVRAKDKEENEKSLK
jgi:hypothetical protein